ncbi:MAG: DUF4351 domain-containing protein [Cyanobacteria bacterium J06621_3]
MNAYEDSLKYYRDLKNVIDTSKEEGRKEATIKLISRQLEKRFGPLSEKTQSAIDIRSMTTLEALSEALLDFQSLDNLSAWLEDNP